MWTVFFGVNTHVVNVADFVCNIYWSKRWGNREFKQTWTTTATWTSTNERFNEQNNSCARALWISVHFFAVLCIITAWNAQFCFVQVSWATTANLWYIHLKLDDAMAYLAWAHFQSYSVPNRSRQWWILLVKKWIRFLPRVVHSSGLLVA